MSDNQNTTAKAGESSTAKPTVDAKADAAAAKKKLPQLGALEDDDEFEEFPAQAGGGSVLDALAKGGKAGERLWEENWDDDDIEDDFTKQLRTAIAARNGADETMKE